MAASYIVANPYVGAPVPVTQTGTVALFPLGLEVHAFDRQSGSTNLGAGKFVYVAGSDAGQGNWVQIQGTRAVALAAANSASVFPIGVAAGALSGTGVYGWVQVQGIADYVKGTDTAPAAGGKNYICAGTTGILHTAAVAGNLVVGAVAPNSAATSLSAGSYTFQLNYPQVVGLTAGI